jgi:hypothetical protein
VELGKSGAAAKQDYSYRHSIEKILPGFGETDTRADELNFLGG